MDIFFIILATLFFAMLLVVTAVLPKRSHLSHYELKRRAKNGDGEAIKKLKREKVLDAVEALQNVKISVLLVLISILSIIVFGWFFGIVIALLVAFTYELLASLEFVHKPAQKLYEKHEAVILNFIAKHEKVFRVFGTKHHESITNIHSKEELEHVIDKAHFLEENEKQALVATIHFAAKTAKDIMSPKEEIASIGKNEMLGPLVLDQLHKTGHSSFPVFDGSPDKIVGILNIKDIVSLKDKQSHMVKTVMNTHVHKINEEQPTEEILADFLHHRSHLFIVIDENKKTVGVVSLQDIVTVMLGRAVKNEADNAEKKEEE